MSSRRLMSAAAFVYTLINQIKKTCTDIASMQVHIVKPISC